MPSGYKKYKGTKRKLKRANKCYYCKCVLHNKNKTLDHVIPRDAGGPSVLSNLVVCCRDCNAAKANMSLKEFQKHHFVRVKL